MMTCLHVVIVSFLNHLRTKNRRKHTYSAIMFLCLWPSLGELRRYVCALLKLSWNFETVNDRMRKWGGDYSGWGVLKRRRSLWNSDGFRCHCKLSILISWTNWRPALETPFHPPGLFGGAFFLFVSRKIVRLFCRMSSLLSVSLLCVLRLATAACLKEEKMSS